MISSQANRPFESCGLPLRKEHRALQALWRLRPEEPSPWFLHILPKGFVKIRYYGILANRNKKTKLELCRRLTLSPAGKPKFAGLNTTDILCILLGKDVTVCPSCGKGTLQKKHTFYPGSSP